jgi:methane monooxygenase component A beta chain/propane monooxygenase small subunit
VTTPVFEGHRTFAWITPQHRHPSQYELFTVGQQSGPEGWLAVDWPIRFDDGRAPFTEATTAVRSSRWSDYRDPSRTWQRPYVVEADHQEQALARLVSDELSAGLARGIDPVWRDQVLGRYVAAWPFAHYGLFLALCYAVREALADTVQFAIAFQAGDRMRHLQDVVQLMVELAEAHPGFTDRGARGAWMTDPVLVPVRETVERIASSRDWVEVVVAVDLVFDPLVGELFGTEFLARNAVRHGDAVTPLILASARADTRRHLASTQELVRLLLTDEEHAAANLAVLRGWIERWGAECGAAAAALAGLFALDGITVAEPFAVCRERVDRAWHGLLSDLGLQPELAARGAR